MCNVARNNCGWRVSCAALTVATAGLFAATCSAEESPPLEERAKAIKTIMEAGGSVWPDFEKLAATGEERDPFKPKHAFVHASLERMIVTGRAIDALAALSEIERLSLSESRITAEQLARLPLPRLKHLDLSGAKITEQGLANLWPLKKLEELDLSRTAVSSRGLKSLATLQNLRSINLSETTVDDTGIAHLAKLPQLRDLELGKTAVGDDALRHLRKSTNLEYLGLYGTRVTDAGLASLQNLAKLTALHLGETGIGDAGIEAIERLPNIETLRLNGTRITDASTARIARWKNLASLDLSGTLTSDVGIDRFRGLKKLADLDLEVTQITDAAMDSLAAMQELRFLNLTDTPITDAGLGHLAKLPSLEVLNLSGTQISDPLLPALKDLPRLTSLYVSRTRVTSLDVFRALPRTRANVQQLRKVLDERTEVDVARLPLIDLLEYLKQRHDIEIQIDHRSAIDAGIDVFDTSITLQVEGITLREALAKILDPLKLIFTVRYEAIVIGGKPLTEPIGDFPIVPAGQRLSPKVAEAFMRPAQFDFAEEPFASVIRTLGERYGIAFELDAPSLTGAGVGFDTPITRSLRGATTLKSALELMFADLDLICVAEGEKVIVRAKASR